MSLYILKSSGNIFLTGMSPQIINSLNCSFDIFRRSFVCFVFQNVKVVLTETNVKRTAAIVLIPLIVFT